MSNPKLSELVSILYANVRIVILKGNHLMIHANAEKHDFILLSEFFINTQDTPQIAEVSLNGYDISRNAVYMKVEEAYYYMQKTI